MSTDQELDAQAAEILKTFGLGKVFESNDDLETKLALFFNDTLSSNVASGIVTTEDQVVLATASFYSAVAALIGEEAAMRSHHRADLLRGQEKEAKKGQLN